MSELELCQTEWGKFLLHRHDLIQGDFAGGGWWDSFCQPVYVKHAGKKKVAIDVGANVGIHTAFMAKHYGHVVAIEAQKYVYWQLCANMALNKLMNVETILGAAFHTDGVGMVIKAFEGQEPLNDFDYTRIGCSGSFSFEYATGPEIGPQEVESVSVDSLGVFNVGVIKVDAQGCDLMALQGAYKTITVSKPGIIFEYEEHLAKRWGETWDDYEHFFWMIGYKTRPFWTPNNFYAIPKEEEWGVDERAFNGPPYGQGDLLR